MFQIVRGFWAFGLMAWMFGLCDRSIATFANGYADAIELMQIFTALFFAFIWALVGTAVYQMERDK